MFRLVLCVLLGSLGCRDGDGGPGGGEVEWKPAFDATDVGWMLSVWGPAGDDLYAVGGSPEAGAIMHFDGNAWLPMEAPADTPGLNWVFGFSESDVYAVGHAGTVLHYDGQDWSRLNSGVDRDLWGIWGASADRLWLVGGNGREEGQATLLSYEGGQFVQVGLPALMRAKVWALFKVWGTSADNVYVVGQSGAVLHFDGQDWQELLVGADDDLIALWGTGPDRIVMVGGRSAGRVVTWNGERFRAESLAPLSGLNGVWMRSPDVVHVVGLDNTLATLDFDTLEWRLDYDDPIRDDFHAVFGDEAGKLTAVGGNLRMSSGPYRGAAMTRALKDDE